MLNDDYYQLESDNEYSATYKNKTLEPTSDLYVKNFDGAFDEEKLLNLFSIYGTITDFKVRRLTILIKCCYIFR